MNHRIEGKYVDKISLNLASSNIPSESRIIFRHKSPLDEYLGNKELNRKFEELEIETVADRVQSGKE